MSRPRRSRRLATIAALLSWWPLHGHAGSLELKVAPLISRIPSGTCPDSLTLIETLQPYREGSYGVDGRAPLEAIATGWRLAARDAFSATWVGSLRPALRRCTASAGMTRRDNAPQQGHSYLRLRFSDGQAQLILDMTGLRDPNNYTPVIQSAGIKQGQPVWSWAGSD
ncbi:MAG: hypothetical protein VKI42_02190 [Synechococcaceae cyanobacterium]|nr:hypothetical protein [Synechococcaceae cyanobacterium]